MITSSNVVLGSRFHYFPYITIFNQLVPHIQPALDYMENMTNMRNTRTAPVISVEFSPERKRKYSISPASIREAIGDMFDGIDESGEEPPAYYQRKRDWEREKERWEQEDRQENTDGVLDIGLLDRLPGWIEECGLPWADEAGLPELKKKMRRVLGRIRGGKVLISVEYFNKTKTIVFYENVLGDINDASNYKKWIEALGAGLFYAWYYDCGGKNAKDYVIEGLCREFMINYAKDIVSDPWYGGHWVFECDMFDIPEAAAQYMENIELKIRRGEDHIIFRRLFKKATTNAAYANSYIEMAYGLYEGLSMPEMPAETKKPVKKRGPKNTVTYEFNGIEYGKGKLCHAIVKQYVDDHPGITSDLLKDVFDNGLQGTRTVETVSEAQARIAKSKDKRERAFMDLAMWIKTADEPCVVTTEWGIDNIDPMLTKAKALGYKIKKREI